MKISRVWVLVLLVALTGCEWKVKESGELIAMEIAGGISGSFFLGCGTIGETEYFFAYVKKAGDQAVKRIKAVAVNARIYEVDGPVRYDRRVHFRGGTSYRFYVPKGTIIPNLDMMRGE